MSAIHPASSQARRTTAAAGSASQRQIARTAGSFTVPAPRIDDELRLNLRDIPRVDDDMEVEGFKPSLLSRLLDLVAPVGTGRPGPAFAAMYGWYQDFKRTVMRGNGG